MVNQIEPRRLQFVKLLWFFQESHLHMFMLWDPCFPSNFCLDLSRILWCGIHDADLMLLNAVVISSVVKLFIYFPFLVFLHSGALPLFCIHCILMKDWLSGVPAEDSRHCKKSILANWRVHWTSIIEQSSKKRIDPSCLHMAYTILSVN